jgi:CRISPR-associated protein Csb2
MLSLEVEYLTGVCFAAQSQSSDQPDFPPQPDRVFSALVAAWGSRGEVLEEKAALEWLEQQQPPQIEATEYFVRFVGISYVPPNDATGKSETMPDRRKRQARIFPAAVPHRPVVRFFWNVEPAPESLNALQALARDTAYLGHSASVVRCRFVLDSPADSRLVKGPARRVYTGRMAELQRSFAKGERPQPGEAADEWAPPPAIFPQTCFSTQWIVLEDAGGQCPDLRAFAQVARRFREALFSRYGDEAIAVPEVISGHTADGSPTDRPHMAVLPLADVGQSRYSNGRLMGIGLVFPRELDQELANAERDWMAGVRDASGKTEQWKIFDRMMSRITELKLGSLGVWNLSRTLAPAKKALQPSRWCVAAKRWASATPIVLDRFPKAKTAEDREEEIAAMIASSCVNTGLPAPLRIRLNKHAAVRGAPSAYPSGKAPEWTGWTLPGFLAGRALTHAVIEFADKVEGPVILGAGRFAGLGLCLGERDEPQH